MSNSFYSTYKRIICMTEESVELLYALGLEDSIIGVSAYVRRPKKAQKKPTISAFTHANINKILSLKPDLVLGYSDIQKDIASELISRGITVFISNHRSIEEVFQFCLGLGSMMGQQVSTQKLIDKWRKKVVYAKKTAQGFQSRPRVYIEEWPDPAISAIQYFSELVNCCGGDNIFDKESHSSLANGRIIKFDKVIEKNPDVILGCWCGKPVNIEQIRTRQNWDDINAVKDNFIYELAPEVFLQPGPALFESGIDILLEIFSTFKQKT